MMVARMAGLCSLSCSLNDKQGRARCRSHTYLCRYAPMLYAISLLSEGNCLDLYLLLVWLTDSGAECKELRD
jgi:hypothetical protein